MSNLTSLMDHPILTLQNQIRVCNFSSPHPFTFTTGEVLPACPEWLTEDLMLQSLEVQSKSPCGRWTDLRLEFHMTTDVLGRLVVLSKEPSIDILLCPLPVATSFSQYCRMVDRIDWTFNQMHKIVQKLRVVRVANRTTKTIYPDRFCRVE